MPCRRQRYGAHVTALLAFLSLLGFVIGRIEGAGEVRQSEEELPPGPFPYIINEANKCPEGKAAPFLVWLIPTRPHEVEVRDAIRRTWGNEGLVPGQAIVRLFLVGMAGRLQQKALASESRTHHDIIQQDFLDTYDNLALKTLMGMNWVARHCPRAKYAMKADSDVFVNTDYLVRELLRPELEPRKNYITGRIFRGAPVFRNRRDKFYVSREEYPSRTFPTYCSGLGYMFSGDMAGKIYGASLSVPRFRFEDVYVGMCLARLGIEPTPPPGGLFHTWGLAYSSSAYSELVAVHPFKPGQLLSLWDRLQSSRRRG